MAPLGVALLASGLPGWAVAQKAAPPDPGQGAVVHAEAITRDVACHGAAAEVQGNRNTLTFTGACRGLTLRGDANTIEIELAPHTRIDIEGNGNRLRYTVAGGGEPPVVRVSGSDTDLAPRAGTTALAAAPGPVRLSGDNQRLDIDCAGGDVDIAGNHSRYTLRGGCRSLVAHGDGNTLRATLQPGARVEIEGNGTVLQYRIGDRGTDALVDAQVTIRGSGSRATRDGQVAVAAPPVVVPPVVAPPVAAPSEHAAEPESANPQASVPQLMHQLGATVVEAGTAVNYTADLLFDGTTDALHGDAAGRLTALARLIRQTHPSAVHISAADPGDGGLAERRAQVVANWLKDHAVTQPITATSATGSDAAVVVLLAR